MGFGTDEMPPTLANPHRAWAIVGLLLVVHTGLLAYSAYVHAPTFNEPARLAAGIRLWKFGEFQLDRVNPPLVRAIAALPALGMGAKTDWKFLSQGPGVRPDVAVGLDFVAANGDASMSRFFVARLACIPFSWLGAVMCYVWARDLYGISAGMFACALWCFCPNVLAHASLLTSDVPASALAVSACYVYWVCLRRPTPARAAIAGTVLGLAELTKTTLLILYPVWTLLWIGSRLTTRMRICHSQWLRECVMIFAIMVISLYVVNFGYGFAGSWKRLGEYQFVSPTFTGKALHEVGNRLGDSCLSRVPVPLPNDYVLGIDLQRRDFETGRTSYLNGELRNTGGWWYYYLYALAVKVPLGISGLLLLTMTLKVARYPPLNWRDEAFLLVPVLAILIFVSSQIGFSEHMRYVLPILPFLFIWISQLAAAAMAQRKQPIGAIAVVLLSWAIMSSLWVYPHSLSYFNEVVGGPKGGPRHLLSSNVDWGQDLLYLKTWMDDHVEARPFHLAYCGGFDPADIGFAKALPIRCQERSCVSLREHGEDALSTSESRVGTAENRCGLASGWYAVSANILHGFPGASRDGAENSSSHHCRCIETFCGVEPVARAGYSINVYVLKRKP